MIGFLTYLVVKHFICDFPLQFPIHYLNKGTFGHRGGIYHAGIHAVGTLIGCLLFNMPLHYALVDFILHYFIDYTKMNLNSKLGLKADNSEKFWWLLGLDQLLHYLTYIWMVS